MTATDVVFWLAAVAVLYPYALYPLILTLLGGRRPQAIPQETGTLPAISLIVPLSNEEHRVVRKMANTASLRYPADRMEVLFVSDGSTDRTVEILKSHAKDGMTVIELSERRGKAAGLNAGLARARHDIVVFSDASIDLEPDALECIVAPFGDPRIGCVSGEDRIPESGGEAWYGRFELALRRLESGVHSIVGASGSFYAQRRAICAPFTEGLAPDFLSVLRTVEQGYRAVSQPSASGMMTSVKDPRQEFERKVRTVVRGLTTLFAYGHLLNPFRYGLFAFILFSHKVMRWLTPAFMAVTLLLPLLRFDSPFYIGLFVAQCALYLAAWAALRGVAGVGRSIVGKASLYFVTVNAAIAVAWFHYLRGVRLEVWTPSKR